MSDLISSYRGVMLCTRPSENPQSQPARFSTGLAPEPLGLHKSHPHDASQKPGTPTLPALLEHKKLLQSIRTRLCTTKQERELRMKNVQRRMKIVRLFCQKQRQAVRELLVKNNNNPDDLAHAVAPSIKTPTDAIITDGLLIDFAAQLDFDKYMADLQFRTAVAVLRDRASAIENEQNQLFEALAEKINQEARDAEPTTNNYVDEEIKSENLDEDIGDSVSQVAVSVKTTSVAKAAATEDGASEVSRLSVESLLKERPELRGVHSKESLKQVINSALAPLLVVSEDAVRLKQVRTQNLPYLYRSPSI
jgi:hypothetical protein